jgi:hypothetical protein
MVQGICDCPRDRLCENCLARSMEWLGGVVASRGYGWASSVAQRRPGLLARPWPPLEGRAAELAAAKVIDLTDDRRLFARLLERLYAAARRRWDQLRADQEPIPSRGQISQSE